MTRAKVYFKNTLAGHLTKEDKQFSFTYNTDYLEQQNAVPISLTLPLSSEPIISKKLHPFFAHLIPEGWLFDLNAQSLKIDAKDEFAMLLATGKECVGAVSVMPDDEETA
ncbi:MAG: hypothetical protein ACD_62C00188G0005 [uncultured bacterium]|nr:MAG: hypothetical protein ACD_62C00188G0005 [uncultured bacterium]